MDDKKTNQDGHYSMGPKKLFNIFKQLFPDYALLATAYYQNGKNSIRIKLNTKQELIFSIYSKRGWRLETDGKIKY